MPDTNTDTDNEFALDPIVPTPDPAPDPAAAAPDVLMARDPKAKGGRGVVKMLVPAAEVGNHVKVGWFKV